MSDLPYNESDLVVSIFDDTSTVPANISNINGTGALKVDVIRSTYIGVTASIYDSLNNVINPAKEDGNLSSIASSVSGLSFDTFSNLKTTATLSASALSIQDGVTASQLAHVDINGRLLVSEEPVTIKPYFFEEGLTNGTNILRSFGSIMRDVYFNVDQTTVIAFNSPSNTLISVLKGEYSFNNQYTNSIYITTTKPTNYQIFANG